jgi:tRNA pseudouridine38-40 synthase
MQRYKITIEYKGTAYAGWQTQKNATSVQETLEKAFEKVLGSKVNIVGSGRTDAGVHAMGQVAHFDFDTRIPADKIPYAVNSMLPSDISVKACEKVDLEFHARFSPKSKTYVYRMYYSPFPSPLLADTYHWITKRPDVELMKLGAQLFVGEHDFKFFRATGSNVKDTVRTIYSIKIEEIENRIEISVTGNGFLYNMVRILSGTLLYIGIGKLTIKDVYDIIGKGDRRRAGKTLPANGLCLLKVDY